MQQDFHYFATFCAALMAGYTPEESLQIGYSSFLVDCCTRRFLSAAGAPLSAATTQDQLELIDAPTDILGLQDITRIWAPFHFLPGALYAECGGPKVYRDKYRLICLPDSDLAEKTVKNAAGRGLPAVGMAMHILADTWAHTYFAGTPSLVINNTNYHFFELFPDETEKRVSFIHNPALTDDTETGLYIASIYRPDENSVMNLGHGRAGHLPDYSFIRYRYLPAWGDYAEIVKDNPADYYLAFCQMVRAMQYLRTGTGTFERRQYAFDTVRPYEDRVKRILSVRRRNAAEDWKRFGEELSGITLPPFDAFACVGEYTAAKDKDSTLLGQFVLAALSQKSLVTREIFQSGSRLAGFSAEYRPGRINGIRDFAVLIRSELEKRRERS